MKATLAIGRVMSTLLSEQSSSAAYWPTLS